MKIATLFAGALMSCVAALPAAAHELVYATTLSGAAESPANGSAGTGTARVTFDLDLATMRVEASFSGLTGNVSASHIHCCTATAGASTAIVATQTPSFSGFPVGGTSGSYDKTFDLALSSSYSANFITASGGTVSGAMNALLAGAADGKAYLNIHTSAFPGGEIRGFLAPVPEPETYALMLLGLGAIGAVVRRRRPKG